MRGQAAVLIYGALNAVLYAGLLPLWDGFDEPFHYGYVQHLSRQHSLAVLGQTHLSNEVWRSLELVPASYRVWLNLQRGIPFDRYWNLTAGERLDLRRQLEDVDPAGGAVESGGLNYEAHQAPLAYALLVPLDALSARAPLPLRILWLRLVCAVFASLATGLATLWLARLLGLPEAAQLTAAFLVLSSQMFYATTAHVANDWLAVPLFTLLVGQGIVVWNRGVTKDAARFGVLLGAALLTKAYFLAMLPFAFWILWRRGRLWWLAMPLAIATPWYARNVWIYHNLSGMQETAGGTPLGELATAAWRLPWLQSALTTARYGLWTGNNSLSSFSSATTWIMLALLALAAGCYLIHIWKDGMAGAERVAWVAVMSYSVALAYATVISFWSTKGVGIAASPWYVQVLLPTGMVLLTGSAHPLVRKAMLWIWTYVIAVTYLAKFIPFYAGFARERARLADLPGWYGRLLSGDFGALGTAALMPPQVLLFLTAIVVSGGVALALYLHQFGYKPSFSLPHPDIRRKL